MPWWLWVVGGLLLLVAEMATPGGFFVLFFGAGAILVGIAKVLEVTGPAWTEWLLFTALSVLGLVFFRQPLLERSKLTSGRAVDRLEGEAAVVLEEVRPGGVGKAEVRGASWTARTSGDAVLARGQRCRVETVDGLTLWLRAE